MKKLLGILTLSMLCTGAFSQVDTSKVKQKKYNQHKPDSMHYRPINGTRPAIDSTGTWRRKNSLDTMNYLNRPVNPGLLNEQPARN